MMVLVLTRCAFKGWDRPKNAICLISEPGRKWGKRKPAATPIVGVFTDLSGKSGAACDPSHDYDPVSRDRKLTEVAILTSERRVSLAVVYTGRVDVNLWPTQGPLPEIRF
jgi:hypothetical protein